MHLLTGKVVLITGGSSGIGRATAVRLASFGARIALAARTVASLEEAVGEVAALGAESPPT
jgi:NAD(P)-dependent dehydrogenase (short-subunit alcohol dehydrogenase family)